jgi:hypothetical protein
MSESALEKLSEKELIALFRGREGLSFLKPLALGSLWFPQFKVDASRNDGEASEERDDHQDEDAV